MLCGPLVYFFHLFTLAGAGEVSQSCHGCQGETLNAEEPRFRFIGEAQHVRKTGDHAGQTKIYRAMGFKADFIGQPTRIISKRSSDGLGCSAHQAAYGSALVAVPEQGSHAKERGCCGIVNDGVNSWINYFGQAVGSPFCGLIEHRHEILPPRKGDGRREWGVVCKDDPASKGSV